MDHVLAAVELMACGPAITLLPELHLPEPARLARRPGRRRPTASNQEDL
jgi:hypothetical protein